MPTAFHPYVFSETFYAVPNRVFQGIFSIDMLLQVIQTFVHGTDWHDDGDNQCTDDQCHEDDDQWFHGCQDALGGHLDFIHRNSLPVSPA